MKYVLDSSVAFKWLIPEIDSDRAVQVRDEARQGLHDLISPDVFTIEVAHALTRAERQTRITPGDGWRLWLGIMADAPMLRPHLPLLARAMAISSAIRLGVYDCVYIALAESESCELLTADHKLVAKVQSMFPFVVKLSDLP